MGVGFHHAVLVGRRHLVAVVHDQVAAGHAHRAHHLVEQHGSPHGHVAVAMVRQAARHVDAGRAIGHGFAVDLNRGANLGRLHELVRKAANGLGRHGANLLGPLGGELAVGVLHPREAGAHLLAVHREGALQGAVLIAAVEGNGGVLHRVPHAGLAGGGVTHVVVALGHDEVAGVRAVLQVPLVHFPNLVQDHIAQRQHEGQVGGGADGHPLALAGLLGAEGVHVHELAAALDAVHVHVAVAVGAAVVGAHAAADGNDVVGKVVVGPHDEAALHQTRR